MEFDIYGSRGKAIGIILGRLLLLDNSGESSAARLREGKEGGV